MQLVCLIPQANSSVAHLRPLQLAPPDVKGHLEGSRLSLCALPFPQLFSEVEDPSAAEPAVPLPGQCSPFCAGAQHSLVSTHDVCLLE